MIFSGQRDLGVRVMDPLKDLIPNRRMAVKFG